MNAAQSLTEAGNVTAVVDEAVDPTGGNLPPSLSNRLAGRLQDRRPPSTGQPGMEMTDMPPQGDNPLPRPLDHQDDMNLGKGMDRAGNESSMAPRSGGNTMDRPGNKMMNQAMDRGGNNSLGRVPMERPNDYNSDLNRSLSSRGRQPPMERGNQGDQPMKRLRY